MESITSPIFSSSFSVGIIKDNMATDSSGKYQNEIFAKNYFNPHIVLSSLVSPLNIQYFFVVNSPVEIRFSFLGLEQTETF